MTLYPFQQATVTRVLASTARRTLLVSPTGTGKTHQLCAIAERLAQTERVLIVVHRVELLQQTRERLRAFNLDHGVIHGDETGGKQIDVGMAQTIRKRGFSGYGTVLIDEAHRDEHKTIHAAEGLRRIIGFTATPTRNDRPLKDWFDEMIVATSYSEAIAGGYIVPARVWAPRVPDLTGIRTIRGDFSEIELAERMSQSKLVGDVVAEWMTNCSNSKTIAFCVNVNHAKMVHQAFAAAGVRAALVSGKTPDGERRMTMGLFRAGHVRVLVNVAVYIEGLDVGDASCIILARPTKSLAFYMQMAGRGCRSAPGKSSYRVLDHSGNVFRFGSPSQDREWSLEAGERVKRGEHAPGLRYCKHCFYVFTRLGETCPNCHAAVTTRPVRHVGGTLEEIAPETYKPIEGFISAYERGRRRAFAEAGARNMTTREKFAFVNRRMAETVAIQRKSGRQLVIPLDPMLLF